MSNAHNVHDLADSGETTTDFAARVQRIADQNRIAQLLDRRRTDRPSARLGTWPHRRFTILTAGLLGLAVADWMAVVAHTVLERDEALSPWLGTHQVVVATLTMTAAVFAAAWALWWGLLRIVTMIWDDQCLREIEQDEIDHIRHKELLDRVDHAARASATGVWQGYASGIRDASGGNPRTDPPDPASVTHLPTSRGGSRWSGGAERRR